jgi:aminopeptidase N
MAVMVKTFLGAAWWWAVGTAMGQSPVFVHECKHEYPKAIASKEHKRTGKVQVTEALDVVKLRAEWEVDVKTGEILGQCTYVFDARRPVRTITFDFSDSLELHFVSNGKRFLSSRHRNNTLYCHFPHKVSGIDSVSIRYRGRPKPKDLGTFKTGYDSLNGHWMWTLSQPYGAAHWFPVRQNLSDKIDSLDVVVTVDEPFFPVSNGMPVREERRNGKVTVEWRHRRPIAAYLIAVAAADYRKVYLNYRDSLTGRTVPVHNYLFVQDTHAVEQIQKLERVFKLYTALFGPYPYENEKYGHARFVRGGGMEHQTVSFVGDYGFELLTHELAHQWFGNHVTCGSWRDLWLQEGYATYCTGLAYRFVEPNWWEAWKTHVLKSATAAPGGSVYAYDTTSVRELFSARLRYSKAACVLRMLEYELGSENFWAASRAFLERYADDFARTEDFRRVLEKQTGRNLETFFADWVYGQGYPSLYATWNVQNDKVFLHIRQTTSAPEFQPYFSLRPVVRICGTRSGQTVCRDFTTNLDANETHDVFEIDFLPDSLIIDPDRYYLLGNTEVVRTNALISSNCSRPRVRVFPNPAATYWDWQTENAPPGAVEISIYDENGHKLLRCHNASHARGQQSIPMEWTNGTYLLRFVFSDGTAVVKKCVLER